MIQQAAPAVNQSAGALTLAATPGGQLVPQIQQVIQPGQNNPVSQESNTPGANPPPPPPAPPHPRYDPWRTTSSSDTTGHPAWSKHCHFTGF